MRARTWILIAAATLTATTVLVVAGRAVWQADRNRQPHVGDSIAAMDAAVAATITAAGDQAAVAVTSMVRSKTCRVGTLHHDGGEYTRAADLFTDPATDATLLTRIVGGLANQYNMQQTGGTQLLNADIGNGVHLQVARLGEGWHRVQAVTDCVIGPAPTDPSPTPLTGPAAQTINALLSQLDTSAAETHIDTLRCARGGMSTTAAISEPTNFADLANRLQPSVPAGAHVFPTTSNRLAYRDGPVSVIVAVADDNPQATIQYTLPC
jgi:hypothetical protein